MQRFDVDTKNGCSMYDSDIGAYVSYQDAEAELSALRARVAHLEQDAKVLRARLATLPEWAPVLASLSDNPETERDGLRAELVRLTQRLATLEAPPVVPLDYEVELLDESGPGDEPFMQWGFSDMTTSDGETSNDDMTPEQRRDLAQLYRALAWAIEHDQRPPHASDGKEGGE